MSEQGNNASKRTAVDFMLAPFKPFFEDPLITEICVNNPKEVFVERAGEWRRESVEVLTFDFLKRLGISVATFANTNFGDTSPIVSAVLPNGERSQFVMPPACKDETISITIRKPSKHVKTIDNYIADGFFNHICPASTLSPQDEYLLELQSQLNACNDPKKLEIGRAHV